MLGTAIGLDEKDGKLTVLEDAFILPSGWKLYDFDVDPQKLLPKEFAKPDLTKGEWLHTSLIFLVNAANVSVAIDVLKAKDGRWNMKRLHDSIAAAIVGKEVEMPPAVSAALKARTEEVLGEMVEEMKSVVPAKFRDDQ